MTFQNPPDHPCGKLGPQRAQSEVAVSVSLINMKGGVGKTTIASQLAHFTADDGLRVLAVDLDPQSNLSHAIMGPRAYVSHIRDRRPTVAQVFDDYIPAGTDGAPRRIDVKAVILHNAGFDKGGRLDLIPSRLELSRTLKNPTGKERRLARSLAQISDRYDLIIIDCAPTESILTDAAYFASRYVIVPVKPEFMATIGLPLLARSVDEFKLENEDHELDIAGLILNDQSEYADTGEKATATREVRDLARVQRWHVFDYKMPYSRSYAKASRLALPLSATPYAWNGRVEGFSSLKDEILTAVGVRGSDR